MSRLIPLLDHLPSLYRRAPGAVVHGLLAAFAVFMDTWDEELSRVQRSHWIDAAFDREDLDRLGHLAGVPGEAWEPMGLYREHIKAVVRARRKGSITREVQEEVLLRLLRRAVTDVGVHPCALGPARPDGSVFRAGPTPAAHIPDFLEWPWTIQRNSALTNVGGVVYRHQVLVFHNRGHEPVPLHLIIHGLPGRRTVGPVVVNRTTGRALGWFDWVPAARKLWLTATPDGELVARLGTTNITNAVWSAGGWDDTTWPQADPMPQPILLAPGDNEIGVFLQGTFDPRGTTDHAGFAVPSFGEHGARPGVFAGSDQQGSGFAGDQGHHPSTGQSLFHEEPILVLDAWSFVRRRATYRFRVPRCAVLLDVARHPDVQADEERLYGLLDRVVKDLSAAGVDGGVSARPFRTVQPMTDRLVVQRLDDTRERGSAGEDTLLATSATFDRGRFGPDRFS